METRIRNLSAAVCVLLVGCAGSVRAGRFMSPAELLSESGRLSGEYVKVEGWMESGFERYRIWTNEDAMVAGESVRDCIGLGIPASMESDRFDGSYVMVEGIFVSELPKSTLVTGGCRNRARIYLSANPVPVER